MSLNLGLNSVVPEEQTLSHSEMLALGIECLQAKMDLDREVYMAETLMNNIHNFNEIVSSLKNHASSECVAFAKDLLGIDISFEVDESGTTNETVEPKSKKFNWEKVKNSLVNVWLKFKKFVIKCTLVIKQKIGDLLKKLHIKKDSVKVMQTLTTPIMEKFMNKLEEIEDDSVNISNFPKLCEEFCKLEIPKKANKDAAEWASEWLETARDLQLGIEYTARRTYEKVAGTRFAHMDFNETEYRAVFKFQNRLSYLESYLMKQISIVSKSLLEKNKDNVKEIYVASPAMVKVVGELDKLNKESNGTWRNV